MNDKKQILNELGDTQRGKDALGRYVLAREAGIHKRKMSKESGEKAIVTHMKNLIRDGPSEERFRRAEAAVDMVANDNAAIRRYTKGVDRARSILGWRRYMEETNMTNEKQILNELGDTLKGKQALGRYLTARMDSMKKLGQEAERMKDVGRAHITNIEKYGKPTSRKVALAYADMVANLFRRTARYKKGMDSAAARIMSPIKEDNSMTIKEHYKDILNERLFNKYNILGKIEDKVKSVGGKALDALTGHSKSPYNKEGRYKYLQGRAKEESQWRRDAADARRKEWENRKGIKESSLLNEIGDTARGQAALRGYIAARAKGLDNLDRELKHIDMAIRQTTDRLRNPATHTDMARQRGMQLLGMEKRSKKKIGRYKAGIDNALARIRPIHAG